MQPSQQPLNPWLVSYIQLHYRRKSRYEIDRYLLDAGYSAVEIEGVWKFIPAQPRSLLSVDPRQKRAELKEWLVFVGSLLFLLLALNIVTWWPFIFVRDIANLILLITFALISLGLMLWYRSRKNSGLHRPLLLVGPACIFAALALFFLAIIFFVGPFTKDAEVATTSVANHDYHLIYQSGCVIECTESLEFYRCDLFNVICPNIASIKPLRYGNSLIGNGGNFSLKFGQSTGYINVLQDNKVIYTFQAL